MITFDAEDLVGRRHSSWVKFPGVRAWHNLQLWESLLHARWASDRRRGPGDVQKECSQGHRCPGSASRGWNLIDTTSVILQSLLSQEETPQGFFEDAGLGWWWYPPELTYGIITILIWSYYLLCRDPLMSSIIQNHSSSMSILIVEQFHTSNDKLCLCFE